jgi:glycosyltransferase involved in cell wall biosynthesis
LRKFDAFLSYGKKIKEILTRWGFDSKRTFIVYNSLNYDEQVKIRNTTDHKEIIRFKNKICGQDDPKLVVFIGRFIKEKKLEHLIHAIKLLRERGKTVYCILIGNGSYSDSYKALIKEHKLDSQIKVLNNLWEEKQVSQFLMAADLTVVPCGAGLVIMHSFVYGTPVLTHNEKYTLHPPEFEILINNKTGILYEEDNVLDLADKMGEFLYPVSKKDKMSKYCMEVMDKYYNPHYQEKVISEAIDFVLLERAII